MTWNGKYFVTIRSATGTIRRMSAERDLPEGATVLATDNGMQGNDYYAAMMARLRAAHAALDKLDESK